MNAIPKLDQADLTLLHELRGHRRRHRAAASKPAAIAAAQTPPPTASLGAAAADWITARVGSWRFILWQSGLLVLWLSANIFAWVQAWDPYPFILLNLVLSFQAAYTAPIIMMSQNRMGDIDRARKTTTTSTSKPSSRSKRCTRKSTCCAKPKSPGSWPCSRSSRRGSTPKPRCRARPRPWRVLG